MKDRQLVELKEAVAQRLLPFVRNPGRYIGGEVNQIKKDLAECEVTVALCFPDIYEIGMSYSGLAIIYSILNGIEGAAAERVFAMWDDAEQVMRKENIPLFSLESTTAVAGFDIVGFSLTNEMCYTNMLNMLDLAGIPLRGADRGDGHPLIIAGGNAANCAEPIADFVDMFVLGEAEEAIVELVELYRLCKRAGAGRREFLLQAARKYNYVYVPSLYEFPCQDEAIKTTTSETITSLKPKEADLPVRFENAIVQDLDSAPVPEKPIVPFVQAVHERVSVEVMRGCPGRCRFCQASFCRRPIRYRSVERIFEIAKANYHATGFDTVSLLSLSTADYPQLEELTAKLSEYFQPRHVGISLPSLRVKAQLKLLPSLVSSVRKGGLTIAVEAASERLRKIINKPITDEDLLAAIEAAYVAGFQRVKLYFMVGFPGETDEDIERIVDLSCEIGKLRRNVDGKVASVNAAVSWLVPKPHTPFGRLGQKNRQYFERARQILLDRKRQLKGRFVQLKFHNIETSILESAIARGDRRLCSVIETAWRNGAKFDLWSECFDFRIWREAFAEHGMDVEEEAQRLFADDQAVPWQHLGGPSNDYLTGHLNDAMTLAGEG